MITEGFQSVPLGSLLGFADRGTQWWAQVCYAERSRAADLLDLANDAEVADLIAMRDLAIERLLPALPMGPVGPVTTGVTMDGAASFEDLADGLRAGRDARGHGGQCRDARDHGGQCVQRRRDAYADASLAGLAWLFAARVRRRTPDANRHRR